MIERVHLKTQLDASILHFNTFIAPLGTRDMKSLAMHFPQHLPALYDHLILVYRNYIKLYKSWQKLDKDENRPHLDRYYIDLPKYMEHILIQVLHQEMKLMDNLIKITARYHEFLLTLCTMLTQ